MSVYFNPKVIRITLREINFRHTAWICPIHMLRAIAVMCAFTLVLMPNSLLASQTVTLEEVVHSVLNSHLEIERQRTNTERSDAAAQQISSAFDWNLLAEGGYRRPRVPVSDQDGFLTNETATNNVYNIVIGMEKRFRNGITIAPGVSYSQNLSKNSSDVLANSVSLGYLAVTIPLLRGRGTDATTAIERAAQETHEASKLNSDRTIAALLVRATTQYWLTVAATRNLSAERIAGKEAAAITETLKTLSEQGELSVLEYQNSIASLNLRRLKIEKSAITWNSTRRKLARIIQNSYRIEKLPISGDQFPNFNIEGVLSLDENALNDIAFENRRDLLALQREVQSKRLSLLKARNDMQPQLDLNLDLDKITVSFAQSIGNNLSKGRNRDAAAKLKAQKIEVQLLKQSISDEVYNAVQGLRHSVTSYQRAHEAYELLEQIANTTRDKVAQGTAARNEYLSALDKLSEVERIINAASVDYVSMLAMLRLTTGTLSTDNKNIKETLNTLLTIPTNR